MEKLFNLDAQIETAYRIGNEFKLPSGYRRVRSIFFCGIGGSAIGGDVLRELVYSKSRIPFVVSRNLEIPRWVGRDTLAVFSSYSGNTWETLQALKQVLARRSKILILTSGGYLSKFARANGIPHLLIPAGLPPRFAIGYLTFSLIPVFERGGWLSISRREIREVITGVRRAGRLAASRLASKLFDRSIYIYGTSGPMEAVAKRWKAQLAENSKMLASHHFIPEMFHNEIEGWAYPGFLMKKSAAVFLIDRGEDRTVTRKRKMAQGIIRRKGVRVIEIKAPEKSLLARIFCLIYLGDRVSYALAILNGVDPVAIPIIERIKRQ